MKFLHDAALAALTSELTDAPLPGSSARRLHGRIEAYTTKRAGTDKRVAHELGERYRLEMESAERTREVYAEHAERLRKMFGGEAAGGSPELAGVHGPGGVGGLSSIGEGDDGADGRERRPPKAVAGRVRIVSNERSSSGSSNEDNGGSRKSKPGGSRAGRRGRRRSKSVDIPSPVKRNVTENDDNGNNGAGARKKSKSPRRARAASFDAAAVRRAKKGLGLGGSGDLGADHGGGDDGANLTEKQRRGREKFEAKFGAKSHSHSASYLCKSPLGDFHEPPARRLMTDLILTLNASFPDYDFSDVKPGDFLKLGGARQAMSRVNERLGEYAATTAPRRGLPVSAVGVGARKDATGAIHHPHCRGSHRRGAGGADPDAFWPGGTSGAAVSGGAGFLQRLWSAIDDVIDLSECEVYSYVPPQAGGGRPGGIGDGDDDPLEFLCQTLAGRDEGDAGAGTGAGGDANTAGSAEDIVPLWSFNYFFVSRSLKRIVFFACVQTVSTEEEASPDDEDEEITPYSYPSYNPPSYPSKGANAAAPPPIVLPDASAIKTGGAAARRLLGSPSAASVGAGSASGYYSVSSSNAGSDVDFDLGDNMARDVDAPGGAKASVEGAEAPARRVVST